MIDIIRKYPGVFGTKDRTYTKQEAIKLIASAESKGSDLQKTSFSIMENHTAVKKLLQLGLRESAIKLAKDVLHNAEWNQHFDIARDICNILVRNAYLCEDLYEVEMYKNLYNHFNKILSLEFESQCIYGDLLYNYERGLPIKSEDILMNLAIVESQLKSSNFIIYYYYYQCRLMLSDGEEYEAICIEAIQFYEELYLKHSGMISIFTNKLTLYYTANSEYIKAEAYINKQIDRCEVGSSPWYRLLKSMIHCYQGQDRVVDALKACDKALNHPKFQDLCKEDKAEWGITKNQLADIILSDVVNKEISDK